MEKLKNLLSSPHIQIALATGSSILLIAITSKWLLKDSIHPILLTVPPLVEVAYEYCLRTYKDSKLVTTWYWVAGILGATALIILLGWIG